MTGNGLASVPGTVFGADEICAAAGALSVASNNSVSAPVCAYGASSISVWDARLVFPKTFPRQGAFATDPETVFRYQLAAQNAVGANAAWWSEMNITESDLQILVADNPLKYLDSNRYKLFVTRTVCFICLGFLVVLLPLIGVLYYVFGSK